MVKLILFLPKTKPEKIEMFKSTMRTTLWGLGTLTVLIVGLLFHQNLALRLVDGKYINPFTRNELEGYISRGDCDSMFVLLTDASFRKDYGDIVKYSHLGSQYCGRAALILSKSYVYKKSTCSDPFAKKHLSEISINYAKLAIKNADKDNNLDGEILQSTISDSTNIIENKYRLSGTDIPAVSAFPGCDLFDFDKLK